MTDSIPVPRDLSLPLPAHDVELQIAIVVLFLAHILFVNLMVGGALLTVLYEVRGRWRAGYDALAHEIAATVTVNKSLAVVLGVGPLLVMNVLYTVHFYSANALTGTAWMMVVPLVIGAFLLLYAHKYSWQALAQHKGLHIALGAAGAAVLLCVPLIFLANVNLMLFPEHWPKVTGFIHAMLLPNVLPRYLHFVLASVAVSALFLAGWFGRRRYPAEERLPELERAQLRSELATVALGATSLQLIAGPLVLFTLPPHGLGWALVLNIGAGIGLAVIALVALWREVVTPAAGLSLRYWTAVAALTGTVVFMGYGRHLYRETALAPHRALMDERTAAFRAAALGAQMRLAAGTPRLGAAEQAMSVGERTFRAVCLACHGRDSRVVGPPLTEIVQVYGGDPEGLIRWVRAPGRKRADYPEMPPISMRDDQYRAVAAYILEEAFAEPDMPSADAGSGPEVSGQM